jgi:hypothetical protein
MEILTFLGLTPKRLVGLGALSALTAAGAAGLATRQPSTYTSTATVFVGPALPDDANVFDLAPLVADFQTVATWKPIVERAATAQNIAPAEFSITTKRNGDGSSVELVATAPTATAAEQGAANVALAGMSELTERSLQRATELEAEKAQAVAEAQKQVELLDAANGGLDPVATYEDVQKEATRLELSAQDPGSQLTDAQRAAAVAQAAKLRAQLPDLAAKKETYRVARDTLLQAEAELRGAQKGLENADAIRSAATDPSVVAVDAAVASSPLPAMVRAGGVAAVVTGLAGVAVMSALDRRRRESPPAAAFSRPVEPKPLRSDEPQPPQPAASNGGSAAAAATTPTTPTSEAAAPSMERSATRAAGKGEVAEASAPAPAATSSTADRTAGSGAAKEVAPSETTSTSTSSSSDRSKSGGSRDKSGEADRRPAKPAEVKLEGATRSAGLFQGRDRAPAPNQRSR